MTDLKQDLTHELDSIPAPDLWTRIQHEASTNQTLHVTTARERRPGGTWLAVAAATIAVALVVSLAVRDDARPVTTTPTASTTGPDGFILPNRFQFAEAPVGDGCCSAPDGGLPFPAGGGLGGSTMELDAVGDDGDVRGQARIDGFEDVPGNPRQDKVIDLACFETAGTDIIFGGRVTASTGGDARVGDWIALLIRRGELATVWWDEHAGVETCAELLASVPEPRPDDRFVPVVATGDGTAE